MKRILFVVFTIVFFLTSAVVCMGGEYEGGKCKVTFYVTNDNGDKVKNAIIKVGTDKTITNSKGYADMEINYVKGGVTFSIEADSCKSYEGTIFVSENDAVNGVIIFPVITKLYNYSFYVFTKVTTGSGIAPVSNALIVLDNGDKCTTNSQGKASIITTHANSCSVIADGYEHSYYDISPSYENDENWIGLVKGKNYTGLVDFYVYGVKENTKDTVYYPVENAKIYIYENGSHYTDENGYAPILITDKSNFSIEALGYEKYYGSVSYVDKRIDIYLTKEKEIPSQPEGHKYEVYYGSYSWSEAMSACEKMGGHLATITSEDEQNYIMSITGGASLWIGGYRDDSYNWYWVTGEPWGYTNWGDGEPNDSDNVVSNENRVAVWPEKWNDLNDNNIYEQSGFICEWDDTELNNIYKMTVFDNDGNTLDGVVVSVDNISSTSDTNGTTVFNKNVMDNEIVNVRVTREGYYTYLDTININDTNELQVNLLKPDEVEKGDVSGNGVINNSDVVYMLKGSAGILQFDDYQLNTADITGDGIFNMQDIIAVINIVQ